MDKHQQAIRLLEQAIGVLQDTPQAPPQAAPQPTREGEKTMTGTIGRPEFKTVGQKQIGLFTAGLKVGETWHNIQAWRRQAAWADHNLGSGTRVTVTGTFETQEWTDRNGVAQSRQLFTVRDFELYRDTPSPHPTLG